MKGKVVPALSLSLNHAGERVPVTEKAKKLEDELQKEGKQAPERVPNDAFGFIPGDFIPGGEL
jgi:hypothetical protein